MAWNPIVPATNRIPTDTKTAGRPVPKPTHIVCHITGSTSLQGVIHEFKTSVSPHYLIGKDGALYQFVDEADQAWHAGIKSGVAALYEQPPSTWQKYLYYFDWAKYPVGSVFVDKNFLPVQGGHMATYVARADNSTWPDYGYFRNKWGPDAGPVNFDVDKRPNAYSVGIEILSVGAKTPTAASYSPAMYATLTRLVRDISTRNGIPMQKGRVVGHEDINPVQRWGWDPNQGFDWSKVWE
jgi:N-acetyl-anhydromuramyl-L-alanine amidase AmpD